MSQSPLALDLNVLIACETRVTHVWAALKALETLGYVPVITPTVQSALGEIAVGGSDDFRQAVAYRMLQQIDDTDWELSLFTESEIEIVEGHARSLLEKGVLPQGNLSDALLVVEAAYRDGKAALLTTRPPILEADSKALDRALADCGLAGTLTVFSPRALSQTSV